MRIAVLVPCRNEGRVIARKLRNLLALRWPQASAAAPHAVLVVDDGSEDDTAAQAAAFAPAYADAGILLVVLRNVERPGKVGAMRAGLARCGSGYDLVVLSDADVVLESQSLTALAQAFECDPRLGMACAAQRFVVDLADDGSCRSRDLLPLRDAGGRYDRWTALVRRLESRRGLLFSVHGQCLAWRASLGLLPREGLAADDLDLMLQVRALGLRVELVPDAVFVEPKTPAGAARDAQALRRARAYVQVVRRTPAADRTTFARLQSACYRRLPLSAPALAAALLLGIPLACALAGGATAALLALGVELLLVASGPGWSLARLLVTIARAMAHERTSTQPDRWEMARA